MEFIDILKSRRSIRKYKKEPIPRALLEEITEAGKWGASARAEYPWRFVIIDDKERLKELAAIVGVHGRFIADSAATIVVASNPAKYYLEDGSAATQNILNAAWAKGIGTCWVAGDKKDYCPQVLKFVNAPEGMKLVSLISCGIPDEKPVKNKPENGTIILWDRF